MSSKKNIIENSNTLRFPRTPDKNKDDLISIAESGLARPITKSRMGRALSNYTNKTSSSYDGEFYSTIKNIRPDWFQRSVHNVKRIKLELKSLAQKKVHLFDVSKKLSTMFAKFINPKDSLYDFDFSSEIRGLNRDWFCAEKRNKRKVINHTTLEVYCSIKAAALSRNLSHDSISNAVRLGVRAAGDFWSYYS